MERTRRQQIVEQLVDAEWEFDDLRHDFGLTVKVLEEDLRHIERSVRAGGQRLILRPACCEACDFVFKSTAPHPRAAAPPAATAESPALGSASLD